MADRICELDDCGRPHLASGYCRPHYARWQRTGTPRGRDKIRPSTRDLSELARFWLKVDKSGPVPDFRPELGSCWLWTAAQNGGRGYGVFTSAGPERYAHRWSYVFHIGPISPGLEIDHLCRVRRCVNPRHLEAVTTRVNLQRIPERPFCAHGHEYTPDNTIRLPGIRRRWCKACRSEAGKRQNERRKASRAARQALALPDTAET